jgi:hypothetical protein
MAAGPWNLSLVKVMTTTNFSVNRMARRLQGRGKRNSSRHCGGGSISAHFIILDLIAPIIFAEQNQHSPACTDEVINESSLPLLHHAWCDTYAHNRVSKYRGKFKRQRSAFYYVIFLNILMLPPSQIQAAQ